MKLIPNSKKAQVSVEFVLLFSVLMTIFIVYMPIFWQQTQLIREKREFLVGRKIGLIVKKEMNTANLFGSGYERNFTLPMRILDSNYTIEVNNESRLIFVRWKDSSIVEKVAAYKIKNSPSPGKNTIKNQKGVINFS